MAPAHAEYMVRGGGDTSLLRVPGLRLRPYPYATRDRPHHVSLLTPFDKRFHLEGIFVARVRVVQDFEDEINKILAVLPRERRTFLFSATMTSKVAKLQRASLKDPARVRTWCHKQRRRVKRCGSSIFVVVAAWVSAQHRLARLRPAGILVSEEKGVSARRCNVLILTDRHA